MSVSECLCLSQHTHTHTHTHTHEHAIYHTQFIQSSYIVHKMDKTHTKFPKKGTIKIKRALRGMFRDIARVLQHQSLLRFTRGSCLLHEGRRSKRNNPRCDCTRQGGVSRSRWKKWMERTEGNRRGDRVRVCVMCFSTPSLLSVSLSHTVVDLILA